MPGRNKTGPEGKGPRSGRDLGPCGDESRSTQEKPETSDQQFGRRPRGMGRGGGQRRGRGQGRQ